MNTETTIVEINGVKMEVDLRQARIVHENLRVGTKVKVLVKETYSTPAVWPGVIVGFEPFQSAPTIIVAYLDTGYNGGLKFAYVNKINAERYELVPAIDDELPVAKDDVLAQFDRDIDKKEAELQDLQAKRAFFLRHFNAYFSHFEKTVG